MAYSADGGASWRTSPRQTYSYTAHFTDKTSRSFCRVERPQLAFSEADGGDGGDVARGDPTHLLNGVCYGANPAAIYACLELKSKAPVMTWTLARPLGRS